MKRAIIVDGYNLIFQFPEIRKIMERDLETARHELLLRLKSHAAHRRVKIIVVFDGDLRPTIQAPSIQGLQIIFSTPPEKADPLIKRLIEKKPGQYAMVVSSDREIADYARLCGVKSVTSQSFACDMTKHPLATVEKKFDKAMSADEVEEWMHLFKSRGGTMSEENDS